MDFSVRVKKNVYLEICFLERMLLESTRPTLYNCFAPHHLSFTALHTVSLIFRVESLEHGKCQPPVTFISPSLSRQEGKCSCFFFRVREGEREEERAKELHGLLFIIFIPTFFVNKA